MQPIKQNMEVHLKMHLLILVLFSFNTILHSLLIIHNK